MTHKAALWIAVLTLSAVILGVLLVMPQTAQAAMINPQPGYVLLTSGNPGGDESLIIIDKGSGKLLMYHLNGNRLEPAAVGDLNRWFGAGGGR